MFVRFAFIDFEMKIKRKVNKKNGPVFGRRNMPNFILLLQLENLIMQLLQNLHKLINTKLN